MLELITSAGYLALGAAVLLGAVGAPLPLGMALAAAGALARQGRLDLALLFAICLVAAVCGDCLGYAAGRYGVRRLPLPAWGAARIARLQRSARRYPRVGMLIFITRWALTLPAPLVNLLAGAQRYPWRSFLFFDLAGEALWCATALVPGYLLGESDEIGVPLALTAGLALGVGGMLLARRRGTATLAADGPVGGPL